MSSAQGANGGITAVLTSCRRPDLLEETLRSLALHAPELFARFIVIEDSDGAAVSPLMNGFRPAVTYVCNGRQKGQLASIDRAYGMVETPYIFHCEDDWRFYRSGFLAESVALLEAFPRASVVACRRTGGDPGHDRMVLASPIAAHGGTSFRWLQNGDHKEWGGYTFNPGLRRTADWRVLGSFARFRSERQISGAFREAGCTVIQLEHSACEHIGRGRHISGPGEHPPLRKRLKRAFRSAAQRLLGPAKG